MSGADAVSPSEPNRASTSGSEGEPVATVNPADTDLSAPSTSRLPDTVEPRSVEIAGDAPQNLDQEPKDVEMEDLDGKQTSGDVVMSHRGEGENQPQEQRSIVLNGERGRFMGLGMALNSEDNIEMKRVKVYELIASRWVDQGTAFCFGFFSEQDEPYLVARSEADFQNVILHTLIRSNDVYQRQQDTLIVWTEPDGVDYALSFQDPEGCAEVWNFICDLQRHYPHISSSSALASRMSSSSVTSASIMRTGRLPQPQLGIIGDLDRALKYLARQPSIKERLCEYIQNEHYIKSIIEVFKQAEDLESLDNLHALCCLMQTILMMNDHTMYEYILSDDLFFGVIGMLEYDPEFPAYKANYREYISQSSRFHQPIHIRDELIRKKVHGTYRLQFMKDVVLARAIDDSTFNVLNSCIIFNQIDIINHVQSDNLFLRQVVETFTGSSTSRSIGESDKQLPQAKADNAMDVDCSDGNVNGESQPRPPADDDTRREVIVLVQQLCAMGKNVQLPARLALFRTLVDRGILRAVQWALSHPEKTEDGRQMIALAGEILSTLLDHDLTGVRNYIVLAREAGKEVGEKGPRKVETVLTLMCRLMAFSRDLAVQSTMGDALKTLFEVQQDGSDAGPTSGAKATGRPKDDPITEKFLEYFYKTDADQCVKTLFKPFEEIPEFKNVNDTNLGLTREKANLYLYLCDLLAQFTLQHGIRSHLFLFGHPLMARVAALLRVRDKHLRLAAFRFFRAVLKLKNEHVYAQMIRQGILKPILDLTLEAIRRENLLSCACQEFFEYMRKDNIRTMIDHCMTVYGEQIRALSKKEISETRFRNFIARWEMNNEPPPKEAPKEERPSLGARMWGQGRLMESEEEDYFNAEDEDEESPPLLTSPLTQGPGMFSGTKRKRRGSGMPPIRPVRPPGAASLRSPSLGALLDYDDDDSSTGPGPDPSARSSAAESSSAPDAIPASPTISHRQIPHPKPSKPTVQDDDEEDRILESLVSKGGPSSPSAGLGPIRPSEKRRREDDDDEVLSRLASKPKRPSIGSSAQTGGGTTHKPASPAKVGEEGPKKIKLKFGATGMAVASSTSPSRSPSEARAKDGDGG